jgi:hypothetical protein
MKLLIVMVVLLLGACNSTPDEPPGAELVCGAYGAKLVYDETIDSWTCIDSFTGDKVYVFD